MATTCRCKDRFDQQTGEFLISFYHDGNLCLVKTTMEEYSKLEQTAEEVTKKMLAKFPLERIVFMEKKCAKSFMRQLPALGSLEDLSSYHAAYHIVILEKLGALPQDFNNGIHINGCELDIF